MPMLKVPAFLGHYTSRVNRPSNEDRYFAGVLELPVGSSLTRKSTRKKFTHDTRQVFNFSVFDGHGGAECSEFLQQKLAEYVENCDLASGQQLRDIYRKTIGGYWRAWGPELDKYVAKMTSMDDLQLRVPLAFLKADYDFVSQNEKSGSTCTSVFLYSQNDSKMFWDDGQVANLVVAHVGDTRCILCDAVGNVHQLTTNHHPSSPIENTRLRRYAASFFTDSFGEERFERYANTRAFGDIQAKAKGITAEPELIECRVGNIPTGVEDPRYIRTFTGNESFLVLMSDGVSEMMSDQEIVDLVINTANQAGSGRGTPQDAAKEIVQYAATVGGNDNATCMVIRLSGWGQWDKWRDRTGPIREERIRSALDSKPRHR
jgi:protein phosphatase PTC6